MLVVHEKVDGSQHMIVFSFFGPQPYHKGNRFRVLRDLMNKRAACLPRAVLGRGRGIGVIWREPELVSRGVVHCGEKAVQLVGQPEIRPLLPVSFAVMMKQKFVPGMRDDMCRERDGRPDGDGAIVSLFQRATSQFPCDNQGALPFRQT